MEIEMVWISYQTVSFFFDKLDFFFIHLWVLCCLPDDYIFKIMSFAVNMWLICNSGFSLTKTTR